MPRAQREKLATPCDLYWIVRPGPDYEEENVDKSNYMNEKCGYLLPPTNETLTEWLRIGIDGSAGGEVIEGWHCGGWWVDVSCVVEWMGSYHVEARYHRAGGDNDFVSSVLRMLYSAYQILTHTLGFGKIS